MEGRYLFTLLPLFLCLGIATAGSYAPDSFPPAQAILPLNQESYSLVYYVLMTAGTPGQLQRMVVDTSVDLTFLVDSSSCPNAAGMGMECYDKHASSTYIYAGKTSQSSEYCSVSADVFSFVGVNHTTLYPFCLSEYDSHLYVDWAWDGVLGMNYQYTGMSVVTNLLPSSWPNIYALDFNGEDGESRLLLGGYDGDNATVVWSEAQVGSARNVEFTLFHPAICGAQLDHSGNNQLMAALATDTPCLALPHDLYDRVMNWIDGECEVDDEEAPGSVHCDFPAGSDSILERLPSFSFQLSEEGEELHVQLRSLAGSPVTLHDGSVRIQFCLDNMKKLYSNNMYVLFGTLPLHDLYTIVDMSTYRVGLRQKDSAPARRQLCAPRPVCIGDQEYYPADNACQDPPCSDYFFHHVDGTTKTCRTYWWFYFVVFSMIGLLALGEIIVSQVYVKITQNVPEPRL